MKRWFFTCFFFFAVPAAQAQDSTATAKKLTIAGYIKDLQSMSFEKNFHEMTSVNLVHNRINLKWKPTNHFYIAAEFRNRIYWGEQVRTTPGFAGLLRNNNEWLNLQKAWINSTSLVLHSNTERLYADFRNARFGIRVGRQRINWGITTSWNPNDIFNTYNFLDFDYEERPGVDAVRAQYFFKNAAVLELAHSCTGNNNRTITALKYAFNTWNYDMQFITGWYQDHLTVGAGWAGNIKDAGFKGEWQYFFRGKDSAGHLNISLEGDYMFPKGWYLNGSILFNSFGLNSPVSNWNTISLKLSPENPMPTRWNVLLTSSKEITPLLSASLGVLYAPGTRLLILLPGIHYNLATNLDLSLVWQSFFAEIDSRFGSVSNICNLRLKWSY